MAMVGLFWIAEGDVYVGAKPTGSAPGVRLTPEGVLALGDGQAGLHLWEDVRALTMAAVPVKTLKRQIGAVTEMALDTVVNFAMPGGPGPSGGGPALMTLRVESPGGEKELSVYAAAAVGYTPAEADLSQALLSRLTDGAATMATTLAAMSEWGRTWEEGSSPRAAEREELLRTWVG
ncbi:hypothetical protein ABZ070_08435 [Streptomyces sp. NPDC006283]|uniref:hypothetical protein n=1 Tax=Streptomyces sp. NPDC006283 TaxID=3156741 RepID=UPI0033BF2E16